MFNVSVLGQFVIALAIIDLFGILTSLGMEIRIVALVSKFSAINLPQLNSKLLSRVYLLVIVFGIFLACLQYLFLTRFSHLFSLSDNLKQFLGIMFIAVIPLSLLRINAQLARGLKKIKQFAVYNYILVYLAAIIVLLLLKPFYGNKNVVAISFSAAGMIAFLLSLIPTLKYLKKNNISPPEIEELKPGKLLKDSSPMLISELMNFVKQWSGIILIAFYLNSVNVGIYSVAFKLASVSGLFFIAVNNMAMPLYGETYGLNDWHKIQRILKKSFKLLCFTSLPIIFIIAFMGENLLMVMGDDLNPGYVVLLILSVGQILELLSGSAGSLLQIADRQHIFNNIVMADTGILILFSLLLLPLWGINGIALSVVLSSGVRSFLLLLYLNKKMKLSL